MLALLTFALVSAIKIRTMTEPRRGTPMAIYVLVGKSIRQAREAKGLSQAQLAAFVGLSRTSITNIEKGRQKFLLHTLAEIAATLGVEPHTLFPRRKDMALPLDEKLPKDLAQQERKWITNIMEKSTSS